MNYYLFQLLDGADIEKVQRELEQNGLQHPFIIEDDAVGEVFIGGHSDKLISYSDVILVEEKPAVVDWKDQWSLFAENFSDGKAHIQLKDKTLLLTPGAGFGDLSHPTTFLMLEMMKDHVLGKSIIDMGTGSGILALSALLLGAKEAIGIDIDSEAIKHAKKNAKLNNLKAIFSKNLPQKLGNNHLLLMNMIVPEQVSINPSKLNHLADIWITSGILEEQKKDYLNLTAQWGWELISSHEQSEWLGFVFKCPQ